MMRLKRAIIKTFLAFSLLLASCSPFNSNLAVYEEKTFSFGDYIAVKAILANYRAVRKDSGELHSSQSGARLIHPDLYSSSYDFYIFGQKNMNDSKNIFGPFNITNQLSSSGDSGEFEINVPKGIWYMTLIAVKHDEPFTAEDIKNVNSKALLSGFCMTDIQNNESPFNFVLSDAGLTTPGKINLKLSLDNWEIQETVTARAGLYYLRTGKAVENTEQDLTISGNDISNYAPQDGGSVLEIKPGSYTFRLTFSANGNDWIWSDQIHIFPGRETDQEIFIPKVINEKPASPEEFAFSLDANPTDQSDYYSGTFTWKVPDSGTTATEYELRLYDEGSGKEYITYTRKNEGSILVRSGSLDSSSTSIQLWLPLGKKLSAQLRAKNRTGTSDESWESTKKENINLYRITYNLQGGSIQNDSVFGSGTSGTTGAVCRYGSVSDPHQWIIPGADDITDSDDNRFDFWSTSTAEDAPALDTDENEGKYTGYENVELYANYKSSVLHPLENKEDELLIEYRFNNEERSPIPEDKIIYMPEGKQIGIFFTPKNFQKYKSFTVSDMYGINDVYIFSLGQNAGSYVYDSITTHLIAGNSYEIIFQATFDNDGTEEVSKLKITLIITD